MDDQDESKFAAGVLVKFGTFKLADAVGAILAHGVKYPEGIFKKGRVLSVEDVVRLQSAGVETVIAAFLGDDDIPEDVAARLVATAACGENARAQEAFTGRANLHSASFGLVVIDETRVRALNHLHESLTFATLSNHAVVQPRQMIATIKVIPFAVPRDVLEKATAIIGAQPLVRVAAFTSRRAGLIITRLPQTKASLIWKSETAMRDRLAAMGSDVADVVVCGHTQQDVKRSIEEMQAKHLDPILVFGASAIVDRADVIPAGLVDAGGRVSHLGMPVDPGNLMMLGEIEGATVVGVPSCARSPKTNGFDWVLERICAGIVPTASDIMDMGTGGLLAEISSRPSPRDPKAQSSPRVIAIVLAGGKSSRMGSNKMMADFHGVPMVTATIRNTLQSSVDGTIVVSGHQHDKVEAEAAKLGAASVFNRDFSEGLSTSLTCGLRAAIAQHADAVVICLADMPLVEPKLIDRLIAAYNPVEHRTIAVPTYLGKFGNPVLWGSEHFEKLLSLTGDRGARALIDELKSEAVEIDAGNDHVLRDADTPEGLRELVLTE